MTKENGLKNFVLSSSDEEVMVRYKVPASFMEYDRSSPGAKYLRIFDKFKDYTNSLNASVNLSIEKGNVIEVLSREVLKEAELYKTSENDENLVIHKIKVKEINGKKVYYAAFEYKEEPEFYKYTMYFGIQLIDNHVYCVEVEDNSRVTTEEEIKKFLTII